MTAAQAPCETWETAWRPAGPWRQICLQIVQLFAPPPSYPYKPLPESLGDADATDARGSLGSGGRRPSRVGTEFMLPRKLGSDLTLWSKGPWSYLSGDAGWQDQGSSHPHFCPEPPTPALKSWALLCRLPAGERGGGER